MFDVTHVNHLAESDHGGDGKIFMGFVLGQMPGEAWGANAPPPPPPP